MSNLETGILNINFVITLLCEGKEIHFCL